MKKADASKVLKEFIQSSQPQLHISEGNISTELLTGINMTNLRRKYEK